MISYSHFVIYTNTFSPAGIMIAGITKILDEILM